jgi:hypothetical protein
MNVHKKFNPPRKIYAGIGSRETPPEMLQAMTNIAAQLEVDGWKLRSGHAKGADTAFEDGVQDSENQEIHLPWDGYNRGWTSMTGFMVPIPTVELVTIAARYHPVWEKLSPTVQMLMMRNVSIILGANLDRFVDMVICWTPGGKAGGGTGHGIRVAKGYEIPVFDIANPVDQQRLIQFA